MRGKRWGLWSVMVTALSLFAMLLCMPLSRGTFFALNSLPAREQPTLLPETGKLVNINTADMDRLMELPNIGEVRAGAIIDYRREHGDFRYPEELIYVPGIGEGILEELLSRITTGGEWHAEDSGRR